MEKNEVIPLKVTDVSIDGKGIGKYNGMAVFVPCTAIGDELEVKILKVKKNYAFGKIQKIVKAAKSRINPDCKVYPKCGGCAFRHISYEEELKIKEKYVKDCINRITGLKDIRIEKIIGAKETQRYRNKMQIPVKKDKNGNIISGFYRLYSHDVVETNECKLNPEIFEDIVKDIKDWMAEYNIEPYDEKSSQGIVRHIYLRQAEKSKEIIVCLVINCENLEFKEKLVNILKHKYTSISGIILNINKSETNVILGEKEKIVYGKNYITDILNGVKLNISNKAFYQVNHNQTEILYETVRKVLKLKGNEKVLELYCGIGSIGLFLAKYVSNLVGVEIVKEAIDDADINAKINNLKNVKFICGDSNEKFDKALEKLKEIDVIIIDPPRKGCERELLTKILRVNPKKIAYISCNPATLARDLKNLNEHGFEINIVAPVDMFPRTGHVECVVLMTKVQK